MELDELTKIRELLEEFVAMYKKDHFHYTPNLDGSTYVVVPPD